jgi:rhamnosyltransferase
MTSRPRVTVLLATLQGRAWLPDQLDSILAQEGVDLQVVVSDDGSDDGTWEYLQDHPDPRVVLLPRVAPSGRSAANFYRLLRDAPLEGFVAFADQDDVWEQGKLARHARLLEAGADGVSSNVVTVWPDGTRALLRKDYPQRRYDWVFESPGPGCSMLLTPRLAQLMRELVSGDGIATRCDYHDWLTYAVCRGHGWSWVIDPQPTVEYVQHEANAMGANQGRQAALTRLKLAHQGWHRRQCADLVRLALELSPDQDRPGLQKLLAVLDRRGPGARLRLGARARQARRRPRDQVLFAGMVVLGVW